MEKIKMKNLLRKIAIPLAFALAGCSTSYDYEGKLGSNFVEFGSIDLETNRLRVESPHGIGMMYFDKGKDLSVDKVVSYRRCGYDCGDHKGSMGKYNEPLWVQDFKGIKYENGFKPDKEGNHLALRQMEFENYLNQISLEKSK